MPRAMMQARRRRRQQLQQLGNVAAGASRSSEAGPRALSARANPFPSHAEPAVDSASVQSPPRSARAPLRATVSSPRHHPAPPRDSVAAHAPAAAGPTRRRVRPATTKDSARPGAPAPKQKLVRSPPRASIDGMSSRVQVNGISATVDSRALKSLSFVMTEAALRETVDTQPASLTVAARCLELRPTVASAAAGTRNAAFFARKAFHLRGRGDFAGAVAAYDEALALDSGCFEAAFNRGFALVQLARFAAAADSFAACTRLRPDAPEAFFNLGIALHGAGRAEEAFSAWDTAVRLEPRSEFLHTVALAHRQSARPDFRAATHALDKARSAARAEAAAAANAEADAEEVAEAAGGRNGAASKAASPTRSPHPPGQRARPGERPVGGAGGRGRPRGGGGGGGTPTYAMSHDEFRAELQRRVPPARFYEAGPLFRVREFRALAEPVYTAESRARAVRVACTAPAERCVPDVQFLREYTRSCQFLSQQTEAVHLALCRQMRAVALRPGQRLFSQGERASCFFLLLHGHLEARAHAARPLAHTDIARFAPRLSPVEERHTMPLPETPAAAAARGPAITNLARWIDRTRAQADRARARRASVLAEPDDLLPGESGGSGGGGSGGGGGGDGGGGGGRYDQSLNSPSGHEPAHTPVRISSGASGWSSTGGPEPAASPSARTASNAAEGPDSAAASAAADSTAPAPPLSSRDSGGPPPAVDALDPVAPGSPAQRTPALLTGSAARPLRPRSASPPRSSDARPGSAASVRSAASARSVASVLSLLGDDEEAGTVEGAPSWEAQFGDMDWGGEADTRPPAVPAGSLLTDGCTDAALVAVRAMGATAAADGVERARTTPRAARRAAILLRISSVGRAAAALNGVAQDVRADRVVKHAFDLIGEGEGAAQSGGTNPGGAGRGARVGIFSGHGWDTDSDDVTDSGDESVRARNAAPGTDAAALANVAQREAANAIAPDTLHAAAADTDLLGPGGRGARGRDGPRARLSRRLSARRAGTRLDELVPCAMWYELEDAGECSGIAAHAMAAGSPTRVTGPTAGAGGSAGEGAGVGDGPPAPAFFVRSPRGGAGGMDGSPRGSPARSPFRRLRTASVDASSAAGLDGAAAPLTPTPTPAPPHSPAATPTGMGRRASLPVPSAAAAAAAAASHRHAVGSRRGSHEPGSPASAAGSAVATAPAWADRAASRVARTAISPAPARAADVGAAGERGRAPTSAAWAVFPDLPDATDRPRMSGARRERVFGPVVAGVAPGETLGDTAVLSILAAEARGVERAADHRPPSATAHNRGAHGRVAAAGADVADDASGTGGGEVGGGGENGLGEVVRRATVVATEPCVLVAFNARTVRAVVREARARALDTMLRFLGGIPLFDGLRSEELARIAHAATVRKFLPDQVVAAEGQPLPGLVLLRSGTCRVARGLRVRRGESGPADGPGGDGTGPHAARARANAGADAAASAGATGHAGSLVGLSDADVARLSALTSGASETATRVATATVRPRPALADESQAAKSRRIDGLLQRLQRGAGAGQEFSLEQPVVTDPWGAHARATAALTADVRGGSGGRGGGSGDGAAAGARPHPPLGRVERALRAAVVRDEAAGVAADTKATVAGGAAAVSSGTGGAVDLRPLQPYDFVGAWVVLATRAAERAGQERGPGSTSPREEAESGGDNEDQRGDGNEGGDGGSASPSREHRLAQATIVATASAEAVILTKAQLYAHSTWEVRETMRRNLLREAARQAQGGGALTAHDDWASYKLGVVADVLRDSPRRPTVDAALTPWKLSGPTKR